MLQSVYRYLLIGGFETLVKRRPTYRYWRELERTQWLPAAEIDAIQWNNLVRLVRHAAAHCPYYRRAWAEAGLAPESLASRDDFLRWPRIDRDVIRAHRHAMRSESLTEPLIAKSTGGSSGVPLQFDLDADANDRRMAAWHRGYGWAGAAPGTRQLYLWGVALGSVPAWKRRKDALYNALYRRKVLNSFQLSDATMPRYLRALKRYRPEVIVAYTNPLYAFAEWLESQGMRPPAPRSIVVGAEKLYDFQRALIERVFAAPVFETYGSREFTLIGAECDRHQGLHLTQENLLVEVLDDEGQPARPGEEGDIVITDLTNYGMPFIRYANGDRAVAGLSQCTCGRGLPLLKQVVGRRLDILTTPDGRRVPGEFFPHLLKDVAALRRFQVVQEAPDRIELRMVLREPLAPAQRRQIEQEIAATVGSAVHVELKTVDDIPLTPAGKLRVVVNHCPPPDSAARAAAAAGGAP